MKIKAEIRIERGSFIDVGWYSDFNRLQLIPSGICGHEKGWYYYAQLRWLRFSARAHWRYAPVPKWPAHADPSSAAAEEEMASDQREEGDI